MHPTINDIRALITIIPGPASDLPEAAGTTHTLTPHEVDEAVNRQRPIRIAEHATHTPSRLETR